MIKFAPAQLLKEVRIMLLERIFNWIRQKMCRHKFQKHYDTKKKAYVYKCVKCGKV